jgi:hypothetical protein
MQMHEMQAFGVSVNEASLSTATGTSSWLTPTTMTCNTAKQFGIRRTKKCHSIYCAAATRIISAESQVDVSLQQSHAIHLKAQGAAALQGEHTD